MEIEEADVLFAQKLADCEPSVRRKAFSRLLHWIRSRMKSKKGFRRSELITLWKGLYYCMWMQDKPLLQEELADRLCTIGDSFSSDDDQHILYLDTFYETIGREWDQLDRWRVDKFMMLFRLIFRHGLAWLKSSNWDETVWNRLSELYFKTVCAIHPDAYPEELKCHFASIYLDELDFAGAFNLPQERILQFLQIYIKLMSAKISPLFSHCIEKEILEALLIDFSTNACPVPVKSKRHRRMAQKLADPKGSSGALQVDYGAIADVLTEMGKDKGIKERRRAVLYKFAKLFRIAASGKDPFHKEIKMPKDLDDDDVEKAALALLKGQKAKKRKRKSSIEKDNIGTKDKRIRKAKMIHSGTRKDGKSRKSKRITSSGI